MPTAPHGRVDLRDAHDSGVTYAVGYSLRQLRAAFGHHLSVGPDARLIASTLSAASQAISTTFNGQTQQVVSGVAYHPFGGVKSYTLGNGQAYTRSYDQDGRISTYTLGAKSFAIGYDAASRIEFIASSATRRTSIPTAMTASTGCTSAVTPGNFIWLHL